ncbi:fluoride efflux transporter CrcB [Acanthopleuribacter pedis]
MWLVVAIGGALGALARYGLALWLNPMGSRLVLGTLVANLLGCFLAGCLMGWLHTKPMDPHLRLCLQTGLLGALTTFSTFAVETLALWVAGRFGDAFLQWGANALGTLLAAWLGFVLVRLMAP